MISEFIAATSEQQPSEVGVDLSALKKQTVATLSYVTAFNLDEAIANEGEHDIGFRNAEEFGEMIGSGKILAYMDSDAGMAWRQVWDSSTKDFQLHFYYEDAKPFYFDFSGDELYMCIAPQGTCVSEEDRSFDSEEYLAQFKAGEIEFKRNLININGVCEGDGGHPECIVQ